jgi:hypothetical protein
MKQILTEANDENKRNFGMRDKEEVSGISAHIGTAFLILLFVYSSSLQSFPCLSTFYGTMIAS